MGNREKFTTMEGTEKRYLERVDVRSLGRPRNKYIQNGFRTSLKPLFQKMFPKLRDLVKKVSDNKTILPYKRI
jgi:hypothetical protein